MQERQEQSLPLMLRLWLQWAWPWLLAVALITLLAACETTPTGVTDVTCVATGVITFSGEDTAETIRQIREHNAAWRAVCGN